METVRELRHAVEDQIDALEAQYGTSTKTPACEVLHFELGIPAVTQRPDAAKMREALKEQGVEVEEDSIKLTEEHEEFHRFLRRTVMNLMAEGGDAPQLAAQMLAVGRRIGMREAADLMHD